MKQPYTITALIASREPRQIDSKTDLQRHQRTHRAGITSFHLTENRIIAMAIHIVADPDPIDPNLPSTVAQDAALSHLRAEIAQHHPGHGPIKFKIYQP